MVLEPMQGKLASSQFDLGHTDLFCVRELTSVFFSSCDSVVGDSSVQSSKSRLLMFDWENAITLYAVQRNRASSRGEGEVSWVLSSCSWHLRYILEL